MLHVLSGSIGTGKSVHLMNEICDAVTKQKSVLVIVPDQFSFEFDKQLYGRLGAQLFNKVTVVSFAQLAFDIFKQYGNRSGAYANDLVRHTLMFLAIRQVEAKEGFVFYNRQVQSPSFISEALKMVDELHWSAISADMLFNRLSSLPESLMGKMRDIVLLLETYNHLLSEYDYKDSLDDLTQAAKIALQHRYFENKNVFVDEFQSFSGEEWGMIQTIVTTCQNFTITLTTGEVTNNTSSLFALANHTYFQLQQLTKDHHIQMKMTNHTEPWRYQTRELKHVSKNILHMQRNQDVFSENVYLLEAQDSYAEADYIAAEIKRLLIEEKYHYQDIAVVTRQISDYASILQSAFLRYEIPYFLDMQKPILHKSPVLFILSLLDLMVQSSFSTEILLRYLKTGLVGFSLEEIALLENYAYYWSIDGILWEETFLPQEGYPDMEELRKKLIMPLQKLRRCLLPADAAPISGSDFCKGLWNYLETVNVEENLLQWIQTIEKNDVKKLELSREMQQLWQLLIEILDTLYDTLYQTLITPREFSSLFRLLLMKSTFALPPQTLDSVMISGAERARLGNPKIVFVTGANEGYFPAKIGVDGLISNRDKSALEKTGLKFSITSDYRLNQEKFIVYTSLCAPSEKLYVLYTLNDISGTARYPSFVIDQLQSILTDLTVSKVNRYPQLHYASTPHSAYYTYIQNYKKQSVESASIRRWLENVPDFQNKLQWLKSVRENGPMQLKDPAVSRKLFGERLFVSASRFEEFNQCPFLYFCRKGLNLSAPSKAELNAAQQGNIIHRCLKEALQNYSKSDFLSLSEHQLQVQVKNSIYDYCEEILGGNFAKSKRFQFSCKRLSENMVQLLQQIQAELSQSLFVPTDLELEIRPRGEANPIVLRTESGLEIIFIGTVDRVDLYQKDGFTWLRVVDYKSGHKQFQLEDILYGINMQMLLYLFTLTEQNGHYPDAIPAGVLYMPVGEAEASLPRDADETEIHAAFLKSYRMNGLLLADEAVLEAMEQGLQGIFIPVRRKQDGMLDANSLQRIITKKQLDHLRKYAKQLLLHMAEQLDQGKIGAVPLERHGQLPCAWCDYWSICGQNPPEQTRVFSPNSKELIRQLLEKTEDR